MPEQHNIEYKQSWRDEYLKTICAYANSQGGKLYIGKDDQGKTIGVSEYKKLMDDLPNKIKNHLGITAEVNLLKDNNKRSIEIVVPSYSVAISFRGRYYIRSGSTTTELTGNSLNDFLLRKSGKTWDDVIDERAKLKEIDEQELSRFIRIAEGANRLPDVEGLKTIDILEKLRLVWKRKNQTRSFVAIWKGSR
ncbi:MAG: ATP-binding protein [Melioribacteraceae bacterium]|nr:ATP-binding protein [Melioribacteraceae bacterium]